MKTIRTILLTALAIGLGSGCATNDLLSPAVTNAVPTVAANNVPALPVGPVPGWQACRYSSCWDGKKAERRMMNLPSPHFSDAKVDQYLRWQKGRGATTTHLILCNNRDGEGGGYSIFGNGIDWTVDKAWAARTLKIIKQARSMGFSVVLWGLTDDDRGWNKAVLAQPDRYMQAIKAAGFLEHCSLFVAGLEMTEWGVSDAQVKAYIAAIRKVYPGKVAVHNNSDRYDYIQHADAFMWQTSPDKSAAQITTLAKKAVAAAKGRPVWAFEVARNPNRGLCEAAFKAHPLIWGCGNW